jgi:hypothetical protein
MGVIVGITMVMVVVVAVVMVVVGWWWWWLHCQVRFAHDQLTIHIHIIAPHNQWSVSQVVKWLFTCAHEVECLNLTAVLLFLIERNYISMECNHSYSMDSMQDSIGIEQRQPHGQVHSPSGRVHMDRSMWTGLQVD